MAAVRSDRERVLAWTRSAHAVWNLAAAVDAFGDVVEADRDDHVGGTLHVRPAVAPR